MAEKSFEQRVQSCKDAEGQTIPFNYVTKFKNKCSGKDVQDAIALSRANKQDLIKASSEALKWTDERAVKIKEAGDNT